MDTFFHEFETASLGVFKRFPPDQRERIEELFKKETEERQKKLEADALKKYHEQKKAEEAAAAEAAKNAAPDPKAKKAPPPAKGKGAKDEAPKLDVPQLEVPKISDYKSPMGNEFLIERNVEEITEQLMKPAPTEEEDNAQDADGTRSQGSIRGSQQEKRERAGSETGSIQPTPEGEIPAEDTPKVMQADVVENDFIEKAKMLPPQDPEGENTMVPDLILTGEQISAIIEKALGTVLNWLIQEKNVYNQKAKSEGKALQDQSVEELDENLRKQWPRKGRLEVEIYQERKSQITAHNRKYERQVRNCLDKYNIMEDEWGILLEKVQEEFGNF